MTDEGRPVLRRAASRLYEDYLAFSHQDLSELDVVFLFVDGVYEAVLWHTKGHALLCAWAICADGTKPLLDLAPEQSDSSERWEAFFVYNGGDCVSRCSWSGLISCADQGNHLIFPQADRQRCMAQRLRNIMAKLPKVVASFILLEFKTANYLQRDP